METRDNIDTPFIALLGFLSALILFVVIIACIAFYNMYNDAEFYQKVVISRPEELSKVVSDQQNQLLGYRWINDASQIVAIPIDTAMDLVVKELQMKVPPRR